MKIETAERIMKVFAWMGLCIFVLAFIYDNFLSKIYPR